MMSQIFGPSRSIQSTVKGGCFQDFRKESYEAPPGNVMD